jgi:hypothetical protein
MLPERLLDDRRRLSSVGFHPISMRNNSFDAEGLAQLDRDLDRKRRMRSTSYRCRHRPNLFGMKPDRYNGADQIEIRRDPTPHQQLRPILYAGLS